MGLNSGAPVPPRAMVVPAPRIAGSCFAVPAWAESVNPAARPAAGNVKRRKLSVWLATLPAAGLAAGLTLSAQAGTAKQDPAIRGAGTTMARGGTGAPEFKPIITKFAFSFRGSQGGFECLALAPVAPAGKPGSGNFLTNVMYVTGTISSVRIA